MLAAITSLIYFSELPKGTKSTGEKREGRVKVEQNTHRHTLGRLVHFKILPFDPWQFFPLSLMLTDSV